jgi:hypothetical protein
LLANNEVDLGEQNNGEEKTGDAVMGDTMWAMEDFKGSMARFFGAGGSSLIMPAFKRVFLFRLPFGLPGLRFCVPGADELTLSETIDESYEDIVLRREKVSKMTIHSQKVK